MYLKIKLKHFVYKPCMVAYVGMIFLKLKDEK